MEKQPTIRSKEIVLLFYKRVMNMKHMGLYPLQVTTSPRN